MDQNFGKVSDRNLNLEGRDLINRITPILFIFFSKSVMSEQV